MTSFRITPMAAADLPEVVRLQTAFLQGSVVTELGPRFLSRFHEVALSHPASCAFAAHADRTLVGFALGSLDVHAFNDYVKPRVLLAMALALLSPARMRLAASLVRMAFESEPEPQIPAELLLLVVHPQARRGGVGRGLLSALEDVFAQHRHTRYRVAVRSQLTAARAFYEALRFEPEQDRIVLGLPMTYLTKPLDGQV
jgi:GNAT superfamily N-acetyltransferase